MTPVDILLAVTTAVICVSTLAAAAVVLWRELR